MVLEQVPMQKNDMAFQIDLKKTKDLTTQEVAETRDLATRDLAMNEAAMNEAAMNEAAMSDWDIVVIEETVMKDPTSHEYMIDGILETKNLTNQETEINPNPMIEGIRVETKDGTQDEDIEYKIKQKRHPNPMKEPLLVLKETKDHHWTSLYQKSIQMKILTFAAKK
jgi:hypothetical protein